MFFSEGWWILSIQCWINSIFYFVPVYWFIHLQKDTFVALKFCQLWMKLLQTSRTSAYEFSSHWSMVRSTTVGLHTKTMPGLVPNCQELSSKVAATSCAITSMNESSCFSRKFLPECGVVSVPGSSYCTGCVVAHLCWLTYNSLVTSDGEPLCTCPWVICVSS